MTPPSAGRGKVRHVDFEARAGRATTSAVDVRQARSGRWVVVQVEGEMDLQADPLVADILDRTCSFVVFDLHGVTFIDASGLRVIADAQRRATASDGGVRLAAPSTCVRRLLTLACSDGEFRVFDTMQEAVSNPLDETRHAPPPWS